MKKIMILFCICIILLTGCSSAKSGNMETWEGTRIQALEKESDKIFEYAVSLDKSYWGTETYPININRNFLGMYCTKVLYYDMQGTENIAYVYDFESNQCLEIGDLGNFNYSTRNGAFIDDTLFFELSGEILYKFDFSSNELSKVLEDENSLHIAEMTNINDKILVLKGIKNTDGMMEYFLETMDQEGKITPVTLEDNEFNAFAEDAADHRIASIDSDGKHILMLEQLDYGKDARYYFTKYTYDFTCVASWEITDILKENDIDSITDFYAFREYFAVWCHDSDSTLLCECTDASVKRLMKEDKLVYAENFGINDTYEYFYKRRSNELYRLNKKTSLIDILEGELDNSNTTIRWIKVENDMLLIEKIGSDETRNEENFWYLVPGKNFTCIEQVARAFE